MALVILFYSKYTHTFGTNSNKFSIKEVVERSEIISQDCTRFDAYYIAYQLAPHAKILKPQSYIDSFIERLDEIKDIYK